MIWLRKETFVCSRMTNSEKIPRVGHVEACTSVYVVKNAGKRARKKFLSMSILI